MNRNSLWRVLCVVGVVVGLGGLYNLNHDAVFAHGLACAYAGLLITAAGIALRFECDETALQSSPNDPLHH